MNFLAHAHLSFGIPHVLWGNMISDFVKGKKQFDYSPTIRKGIMLHRAIDSFTDVHPATGEIKNFFRPVYRLYSGPLTDIVYDYFLANDEKEFTDERLLKIFCDNVYKTLVPGLGLFPPAFREIYPSMVKYNWLFHYRYDQGIQKSISGLVHRSKYITESETAFQIFLENKKAIQLCYNEFYPSVKNFALLTLEQLSAE